MEKVRSKLSGVEKENVWGLYERELQYLAGQEFIREKLQGRTVMVSGATGMIGKCLIDFLMLLNKTLEKPVDIIALSRNPHRAEERFAEYWNAAQWITSSMRQAIHIRCSIRKIRSGRLFRMLSVRKICWIMRFPIMRGSSVLSHPWKFMGKTGAIRINFRRVIWAIWTAIRFGQVIRRVNGWVRHCAMLTVIHMGWHLRYRGSAAFTDLRCCPLIQKQFLSLSGRRRTEKILY